MGIRIRIRMTITEKFRDVLKKQQYEVLVLDTLNRSRVLLKNAPLKRVSNQHHGESDYIDTDGNKYDVKLLIDKQQGAFIGERKNDMRQWIESMMNECSEFSKYIVACGEYDLTATKLYKVVRTRIEALREDEIGILFCPYPLVHNNRGSYFLQGVTDFLQAVYDRVVEDKAVRCKDVYFMYPSMEKDILCLRNGKTREREYIESPEIGEYISFDTVEVIFD